MVGQLPAGYVRVALWMYWQVIRQYCTSVAEYLERYYPGDKTSHSLLSPYQMAKAVDAALQELLPLVRRIHAVQHILDGRVGGEGVLGAIRFFPKSV